MIPAQRHAKILTVVRDLGGASIDLLAEELDISPSTVRRDLRVLTDQGYLQRSRGGAIVKPLPRTTFEPESEIGSATHVAEKIAIAAIAAARVEDGQSVILDSGSTVHEASRWLVEREVTITAVTNDLGIAATLRRAPKVRLVVVGGSLRPHSQTLVGDPGLGFLQGLRADVALIGIHSLAEGRLSESSTEVAMMKRASIAAGRRRIVLADSSKFAEPSFTRVCDPRDVDELITDAGATPEQLEPWKAAGLTVSIAATGRPS